MGFSRQEYWTGLPFPSPGDLPDPGIEARSPALQADTLPSEPPGKPSRGGSNTGSRLVYLFVDCRQHLPISSGFKHRPYQGTEDGNSYPFIKSSMTGHNPSD